RGVRRRARCVRPRRRALPPHRRGPARRGPGDDAGTRRDLAGRGGRPAGQAGDPRARAAAPDPLRARPVRQPPAGGSVPRRADARALPRRRRRELRRRAGEQRGPVHGAGGFHRKGTPHEVAVQESINTRRGVERIVRYAFELARAPGRRGKVTLVHKTNVLTFAGDLYQRVVDEVAREYPAVETDYVHVDAACIYFLDQPSRFDVIVTDNMFG